MESCEFEVRRLWESSVRDVSSRLSTLCQGLKHWVTRLCMSRYGNLRRLHSRFATVTSVGNGNVSLLDLLSTKNELNLKVDKKELYWEQRAQVN